MDLSAAPIACVPSPQALTGQSSTVNVLVDPPLPIYTDCPPTRLIVSSIRRKSPIFIPLLDADNRSMSSRLVVQ